MLTMNETRQNNAKSTITVNGNEKVVAIMNATVPEAGNGNISLSAYVQDRELFESNRASVTADIVAFVNLIFEVEE